MMLVMLILRTYALYERNRRVLTFMVLVSVGVIATGIVSPSSSSIRRLTSGQWSVLAGPGSVNANDDTDLHLFIGCSSSISAAQCVSFLVLCFMNLTETLQKHWARRCLGWDVCVRLHDLLLDVVSRVKQTPLAWV
jgi:hypothetical protein